LPPESATLELVSKELGIAAQTLQRWRDGAGLGATFIQTAGSKPVIGE
jgi:hypothetical protein